MAIMRVTARWSGFSGAPGYSSFHFSGFTGGGDPQSAADRVAAFFTACKEVMPTGVGITVSPTVEVLDEATGVLQDYVEAEDPIATSVGTSAGSYSGAAGGVVNWLTNTVAGGRRVRGRTFVVPLGALGLDDDGTLSSRAITALGNGANAIRDGGFSEEFVVWKRPVGGGGGVIAPVTGHRIPDMTAILRSRRD